MDTATLEKAYGLPTGILKAVMQAESSGNPKAINTKTATGKPSLGLMQFQPDTAKAYGIDPMDPNQAVLGAAKFLKDLKKQYKGDIPLMLAGYNWGSGNIAKHGMENAPEETRNYIKKVTGLMGSLNPISEAKASEEGGFTPEQLAAIQRAEQSLDEDTTQSTPPEAAAVAEEAPVEDDRSAWDKYGQPFVNTFKSGLKDAKDFATMNYAPDEELPYNKILRAKVADGTYDRLDIQRAFLEGMHNNPGGKALGAAMGIIPEFNILATGLTEWINPEISERTGIDESTLALAEMGLPFALKGAKMAPEVLKDTSSGKPPSPPGGSSPLAAAVSSAKEQWKSGEQAIPSVRMAGAGTKKAMEKVTHPLSTAAELVEGAMVPMKAVTRPAFREFIDRDNPITGEPGLKSLMEGDVAKRGMELQEKFPGMKLSAGELTGNPTILGLEDALANSARWGGRFNEAHAKKTQAVVDRFYGILDNISKDGGGPENVGNRVSTAYNNTINNLIKTRSEQAKIDFNSALENARQEPTILSNNLFTELQAIVDEGNTKLLTKSKSHAAAVARGLLKRVSEKTKAGNEQASTLTLEDMANGLSNFSAEARRPGGSIDNAQSAAERRVYARLMSALSKDLDAEIEAPKGSPERAAMLKVARDNFKQHSQQISDIENTTLGRMIGHADTDSSGNLLVTPEKVVSSMMNMKPSEIRSTLDFLDKNNPESAAMARRYILESALDKAVEGKGLREVGGTKNIGKAQFIQSLPDKQKLKAILGDEKSYNEVMEVAEAMNRLIDWGAYRKGSHTAQRTDVLSKIKGWSMDQIYKSLASDTLAQDLLDPTLRAKMAKEIKNGKSKE